MKMRIAIAGLALIALPAAAQESIQAGAGPDGRADAAGALDASQEYEQGYEQEEECRADLCLHDGLFYVWGEIQDPQNPERPMPTTGQALPGDAGGILYAWSPDNPELLVKVLDGCEYNQRWWVFVGSAIDQPYTIVVKHIPSDETRQWDSNSENPLLGMNETDAFPYCE